jgi:putative transposase
MARMPRIVVPQYPHHIVQRGNRRMDVFFTDEDRLRYLDYLGAACQKYGVAIWAYCLMRNHVHFVAVPSDADSLARSFSEAHAQYTRRINLREKWQGHLWQGRFGSSVLDQHHLLAAVRYVERNPVRAGIVADAWEYPWSSAAFHVGKTEYAGIVSSDTILPELIGDWKTYLKSPDQKDFLESVHRDSPVNRPLGDAAFVDSLERKYRLKMTRGKAGRPTVREQPLIK